jgi:hypothetical protein
MAPSETIHTSYDILEIQDHRHLHNQTTYLVTQWRPEILTQEQIDICTKEGFKSKHIHPLDHTDGRPLYEVHWEPAWQLDSTIMDCENGPTALQAYKQKTQVPRRVKRRTPLENPITKEGWRSTNLTFSTTPINPDLDINPTGRYELTQHPTNPSHSTLHRPDGTLISTIENRRLDKLHDIYNNTPNNPPFEESLAHLIHKKQ